MSVSQLELRSEKFDDDDDDDDDDNNNKGETESTIVAAQDQAISANYFKNKI